MAGNRKVFQEAMSAGANAAWDADWDQAIAAYKRALAEFPQDADALTALGLAYSSAGKLDKALDVYQQAREITPDEPVLLERLAQVYEQLRRDRAAAETYMASAEQYLSQQQATHLALDRWQDAVRAYPDHRQAHAQLLHYYQRNGQIAEAVEEYLALARIYQARGRSDYAADICRHALKLAPHDPKVLSALDEILYAEQTPTLEEGERDVEAEAASFDDLDEEDLSEDFGFELLGGVQSSQRPGSPIETTRQRALTDLAESVFADEVEAVPTAPSHLSKMEMDALIGRAIDFQTRGQIEDAIRAYEQVLDAGGGTTQPAVHFNLGLLYQEKLRFEDAIKQFTQAVLHPEYTLGGHFALGECYRAKGRVDDALEHFVEVLKIVDLATVNREQADDLIQLYESLADSYIAKGEREQALEFTNSLVQFLGEKGWEDKVAMARHRLDSLDQEGPAVTLAEMLTISSSEEVLESVSLSQECVKRKLFYAALEECYYALEYAPTYLPIHRQLAQIFLAMSKVEEAVQKFVAIGDTYRVRGDVYQAVAMYHRALKLTPVNTQVRAKLIDMLVSHGEIDEALENYLLMADSYYQMAQMDQARETYQEALRLAPRGNPERHWEVRILHKIGDIDMQRVDWKRAIGIYEQIRDLEAEDERARLTLMQLYYRFNRPRQAIAEIDALLKAYRDAGKQDRMFTVLEDAVRDRENDIPLRARLAQVYLNAGRAEDALKHLDKLGDLQLAAERYKEARATVRAIIALNPPNVEEYHKLLGQLG